MLKSCVISLTAGLLAGVIYALIDVNAPAPPVIALLGLSGMLVGEQIIPLVKRLWCRQPMTRKAFCEACLPKITGTPPRDGDNPP
ncbi:DUF1427 family protein [Pantoea sp. GD03673]|uniref:DUF1427 family protein n=1 Tax=Pantoea sp. GD03673 TaxID=2975364 RepID=UPI0024478251|nr:DUF1427 family protein [Pantoea sp. GD03673]MDH2066975.1 XapX domain-containing protein [Pantoea sp. GD03673]